MLWYYKFLIYLKKGQDDLMNLIIIYLLNVN